MVVRRQQPVMTMHVRPSYMKRALVMVVVVAVSSFVASGCGSPRTATFYDPNEPGAFAGGESDPATKFGVLPFEHVMATMRLRARVVAARALVHNSSYDLANEQLQLASEDTLVTVLGAVSLQSPAQGKQLLDSWISADGSAPAGSWVTADDTSNNDRDREGIIPRPSAVRLDRLLAQLDHAQELLTPPIAREDAGWNAGIVSTLLEDSGTAYENAFLEGLAADTTSQYAQGWGTVQVVQAYVKRLPRVRRRPITDAVDEYAQSFFPSITAQDDAASRVDRVVESQGEVSALIEDSFRILIDGREPRSSAPRCLASTQEALTKLREQISSTPINRLRTTHVNEIFRSCAPDVVGLDPQLVGRVEYALGVSIPAARATRASESELQSIVDNVINDMSQASSLVNDELAALEEE